MIDQNAQLHELPAYWQEQVRKYRVENRELRQRLKHNGIPASTHIDDMPVLWQNKIRETRTESAKYRHQRNDSREELAAVKAELAALNVRGHSG